MNKIEFEHKVRKEVDQLFSYDSSISLKQSRVLDGFDYNLKESVLTNIKRIIIEHGKKTGKQLEFCK